METLWFCLVAVMIALYVVFDGFDLGVGIIHLGAARSEADRRTALRSIGPVWNGNEVWLIAGGGALFFAFPALYASSFSGFYLPLMMVLWLLMLRGIAVELRGHLEIRVWTAFWDAVFMASSGLLAVFYGVALGNVVRGVPLDAEGRFFLPLWTDFQVSHDPGIIDWYTVTVGLAAFFTLTLHGAVWLAMKTEGDLQARARRIAQPAWWLTAAFTVLVTAATWKVQPHVPERLAAEPWGAVFPLLALAGLAGIRWSLGRAEAKAFLSCCAYIVGMLTSVAFGVYPYVLPSNTDQSLSLNVVNSAASAYGLKVGLAWFIPGILLVTAYFVYVYRLLGRKVSETEGLP